MRTDTCHQTAVTLPDLPSELWIHILSSLVEDDALMLQSTNKRLFKLCDKKFGWISPNDNTMRYFAEIGAISCLKYMHDIGNEWDEDTIASAARQGQLETIKFLHQNGCEKSHDYGSPACKEAARNGYLACLQYLHENGFQWSENAFHAAVFAYRASNNFEILTYLRENGCPWNSSILIEAASVSLDCLKYVMDFVGSDAIETHKGRLCSFAAAGDNNLETLKYLHEAGYPVKGSCERAASVGSLECLKYAHEHGDQWRNTLLNAIEGGHIECIKYALENGDSTLVDDPDFDINSAVESGNIECVKLLIEHGVQWNGEEYEAAARRHHLDMVKYLFEVVHRPKPKSNEACMLACGNLPLLKYLHENGFSWDGHNNAEEGSPSRTIVYDAVEYQSLPCLKYILECGYEIDTNDLSLCTTAAVNNDVEILRYLISLGCKIHHSIMEVVARSGALKAIRYLHKSGTDLDESVATSAAKKGQTRVLEYALKHGYGLNSMVCDLAAANGHVRCLKVAHKYGVPFTANTMLEAGRTIHRIDCMKYLHEHGCEWTHQECTNAAKWKDFDLLKYVHENGSQWNEETWYFAVKSDTVKCLEYLYANGCPQDPRTFDMTYRVKCYAFMQQHNIIPNTKIEEIKP